MLIKRVGDDRVLISIAVPVYNCEKTLERCVNSLTSQSYKNIEIILVDDCSPDSSLSICEGLAKKDKRIKVISHEKNMGPSSARNTGIKNAAGEYIFFVDSDDYVNQKYIIKFLEIIEKYGENHLVICGFAFVSEYEKGIEDGTYVFSSEEKVQVVYRRDFLQIYKAWLLSSPCNKAFSLAVLKKTGLLFDETLSIGEDILFCLEYIENIKGDFVIINEPLYNYVQSNSQSLSLKYQKDYFRQLKLKDKHFKKIYSDMNSFDSVAMENCAMVFIIESITGLENVFKKTNKKGFLGKVKEAKKILKSPEYKNACSLCAFHGMRRAHKFAYKSKSLLLITIYHKLMNLVVFIRKARKGSKGANF